MQNGSILRSTHPEISDRIAGLKFRVRSEIETLPYRDAPYFQPLLQGRHVGIHRPHDRACNWTARYLTNDKRYLQKCLGPALDLGRGYIGADEAINRALAWFDAPEVRRSASTPARHHRTNTVNICPIGDVYTVGHALRDYTDWTRIARSPGGHYNMLALINHHLIPHLTHIPLEEFNATHLRDVALKVLETPPRHGFSPHSLTVALESLSQDQVRKRKRTFNSLVTILKMAFRQAWDNGAVQSERSWRCLKRVPVIHSPRRIFLDRAECQRLVDQCTPALRRLVLGAIFSGCRVGELANLRVEDVGFQGYGVRVQEFKRSPARFVFLPDEGMAFFLACCEGKSGRDRIFLSDRKKTWKRQHANLFRRAVARAKLPRDFVFHGLRHTYASELVRAGVSLEVIARQLGHADIRTVAQTYGHLAEHFREQQIRENFPTLGVEHCRLADEMAPRLHSIWSAAQAKDWREYARTEQIGTTPLQSSHRTSVEVLEVFGRAGRRR